MKRLSIVYQTHWDREWYYTVDTYLVRMKQVLSRIMTLLDDNQISSFVFDGQVRALEDYLMVCEEQEKIALLNYVKTGKIIIGPWYVLADEFLVSGESLVRNLEMGIQKAKTYGTYQHVGYLPDTFGHVSQMPQILQSFGIDNAVLWRGVVPNEVFFDWEAANKDKVFTLYLKEGYYQPVIEQEQYQTLFENFVNKLTSFSNLDHHILTNGGDHLMPANADIQARLKILQERHNIDLKISTFEEYIDTFKGTIDVETIHGELRDNSGIYVLPNVLSSRYYLKQQNQSLEYRLRTLEGLIAKVYPNTPYPHQEMVRQLWETLLLNHPHDSICGCSIDDVHLEMETRTRKMNHQIDALLKGLYSDMGAFSLDRNYDQSKTNIFSDYSEFTVINPTIRPVNGWQEIDLFINEQHPLLDTFVIADESRTYTTIILDKVQTRSFESPLEGAPEFRKGYQYKLAIRIRDVHGLDTKQYRVQAGTPEFLTVSHQQSISNGLVDISVSNNKLVFTDCTTKNTYHNMHQIMASLDAGDEYNYSKPVEDVISLATITDVKAYTSSAYQRLVVSYQMSLPEGLQEDYKHAKDKMVTNEFTVLFHLKKDDNRIYVDMTMLNRAKDHRTSIIYDANQVITNHYSDTAFDIVKRTVRTEEFKAEKGKEVPVVVDPTLSKIHLDSGLTIEHIGMQEYQIIPDKETSTVRHTLLRSVGYLSRDDLRSRGGGAGPSFETPDAQQLGTHHFKYAITLQSSDPYPSSDLFVTPLLTTKGHADYTGSLLQLSNTKVHLSSLRKTVEGLELRLFNPSETEESFQLQSAHPIASVQAINMLGTPINQDSNKIGPKQILTLNITFGTKQELSPDALVVGGSIGGVQAAISLAKKNRKVILTEQYPWIGGQLTSQAVPLDEHPFIEEFGCTKRYRSFRDDIREYYATNYQLQAHVQKDTLNPGNAWVTRLAFEPEVAHEWFLREVNKEPNIKLFTKYKPVYAETEHDTVTSVILEHVDSLEHLIVNADYVLDGTDLGDLLPLTKTEYTTGRDSVHDTNEPHATEDSDPNDRQPVTHVVAMKWDSTATKPIAKPAMYDTYHQMITPYSDKPVLSEYGPDSSTGKERRFNTYDGRMALWRYRRFFDPTQYVDAKKPEMTTINWPQNDYFMGNIFDDENDDIHLEQAKELTKSFVYYLQTEVPRHDGGKGYPEMQIASNTLGTKDGFAMAPYIRESRRIQAMTTIKEQDVSASTNQTLPHVKHSVGVGSYHIDLHITTKTHRFFYDNTWPFEIPLGAFIPVRITNLLPACKNIGTTHLTNGCFRLHPVEWNIGEVAGYLTDFLLRHNLTPQQLYTNPRLIETFQDEIKAAGVELYWPEDKVRVI